MTYLERLKLLSRELEKTIDASSDFVRSKEYDEMEDTTLFDAHQTEMTTLLLNTTKVITLVLTKE